MEKRISNRILTAILMYATAVQILFFVIRIVYFDVLLIPSTFFSHLLTKEYWLWILDVHVPAFVYEDMLVRVVLFVDVISLILLLLGIAWFLSQKEYLERVGKRRICAVLGAGALLYLALMLYERGTAHHYRLYMALIGVECLSAVNLFLAASLGWRTDKRR